MRQLLPMYVVLISSHEWVIFAARKKKKRERISFVTLNAVRLFRSLTWDLTSCSFPGKSLEVLNYTKSISVLEYYCIVYVFIRIFFFSFWLFFACHIKYFWIFSLIFLPILSAKYNSGGNCSLIGKALGEDLGLGALSVTSGWGLNLAIVCRPGCKMQNCTHSALQLIIIIMPRCYD